MKKILLVLLGLTVTLVGCGNLSVEEKEDLIEAIGDIDEDDFEEMMENSKYIEVENENLAYYIRGDNIKEDKIDYEDLDEYYEYDVEGEIYVILYSYNSMDFVGSDIKKVKDGYITFLVHITKDSTELIIILTNNDGDEEVNANFTYENGEFELDEGSDESEALVEEYEKEAKKFFEKTFKELDSVINY